MSDVSRILQSIKDGDRSAAEELLPLVYDELRRLAQQKMAQENPAHTLQATALVHEAWLRLGGSGAQPSWDNRRHFFAAAAEAMRRILVENARRKARVKHGGDHQRVSIDEVQPSGVGSPDELLQIDEALEQLCQEDEVASDIVRLCYFAGLEVEEAAEVLGISRATAYRHWAYAKAWLRTETRRQD